MGNWFMRGSGLFGRLLTPVHKARARIPSPAEALAAVLVVGVPILLLLTSYLGSSAVLETWLYRRDDGGCPQEWASPEGIGPHCFGDIGIFWSLADESNPWANSFGIPFPNPPTSFLLAKLLFSLGSSFENYRLVIALNFFLLAIAAGWATRALRGWSRQSRGIIGIIIVLGFPMIYAIDRGNQMMFLGLLFIVALAFFYDQAWSKFGLIILLISLIKPQFLVLLLFLVARRRFGITVGLTAAFASANIAALLVLGVGIREGLSAWFKNLFGFMSYQSVYEIYPQNISVASGIAKLTAVLASEVREEWIVSTIAVSLCLLAFSSLVFQIFWKRGGGELNDSGITLALMTLLISVAPSTSYAYYGLAGVLGAGVLLRTHSPPQIRPPSFQVPIAVLAIATFFIILKVPLFVLGDSLFFSNDFAGVLLVGGILVSAIFSLSAASVAHAPPIRTERSQPPYILPQEPRGPRT